MPKSNYYVNCQPQELDELAHHSSYSLHCNPQLLATVHRYPQEQQVAAMPPARPDHHRGRIGDRKDRSNDRDRDRDRDRHSGSKWWDNSSSSRQDDKYQGQWKRGYSNGSSWSESKQDWNSHAPMSATDVTEEDLEAVAADDDAAAGATFTQLLADTRRHRDDKGSSANVEPSPSRQRDDDDRRSSGSERRHRIGSSFKNRWSNMEDEATERDDTIHCKPKAMSKTAVRAIVAIDIATCSRKQPS